MSVDECDVHRELAIARDELLRAIERIDEPVALPLPTFAVRDVARLLGKHRHVWRERAQTCHDDVVRLGIGQRERRLISLVGHLELLAVHAENRIARAPRERNYIRDQALGYWHCSSALNDAAVQACRGHA